MEWKILETVYFYDCLEDGEIEKAAEMMLHFSNEINKIKEGKLLQAKKEYEIIERDFIQSQKGKRIFEDRPEMLDEFDCPYY